jgi:hypothetical protein
MGTMRIEEKYSIDKRYEGNEVFSRPEVLTILKEYYSGVKK